ncbi:HTH-type transcriptional regulator LeuO [Raoultella terrigena]|uniref:HTH-type transcriptional regulator LeuO n=1 Tax=Raoultella terrigena TaxID=577 RepID=A0A3P8K3Z7_RAOTE|nr:HTH-type transcriptional regulator LeuO [Raoultella terrigena]
MINLHRLDLNLLRTLDVLLSENNVTRAAQRLNLSQPSVSIQLARLPGNFCRPAAAARSARDAAHRPRRCATRAIA